jgi:diguanylate cyclase (GGDEF)-like protein
VLTIARLAVLVVEQRRLAITDSLTGVHSRRFLEVQLPSEVARAERDGGAVALCIIDVDRFKTINDSYGHPAGDRALIEIARRLRLGSRTADLLVRYGGEEFALLMPGARADQLAPVAERLRAEVARTPVPLAPGICSTLTVCSSSCSRGSTARAASSSGSRSDSPTTLPCRTIASGSW